MLLEKKQKEKTFARRILYLTIGTAIILLMMLLNSCTKDNEITANYSGGDATLIKPILLRTIATDLREKLNKVLATKEASPYANQFCNLCKDDCVTIEGTVKHSYNTVTRNGVTLINEQFRYFNLGGISNLGKEYTGEANHKELTKIYPDNSWVANVDEFYHFGTADGDSIIIDYSSQFSYSPTGELTVNYLNDIKICK